MHEPITMPPAIDLDSSEITPLVRCGSYWLCQIRPGTAAALTATDFIRSRFLQAYGARPVIQPPLLLVLVNRHGALLAAVGVRLAQSGRLFLEDYLDQPVEHCLSEPRPDRQTIVEIAHLAGVEAGASRLLFTAMALWLEHQDLDWVVCTGTGQLRNGFRRMGIAVVDLGRARPERLADGGEGWGCYYQHQPRVMAVNVPPGLKDLRTRGLVDGLALVKAVNLQQEAQTASMEGRYGHIA